MNALVLGGAGAVARETTRDLAAYSDFERIVVADANPQAVEALLAELDDPRLQPQPFDADDYDGMLQLFPGFDIVVNGLPFKYDLPVTRACVEVGVSGLDLSSEDAQFALHQSAAEQEMTFIPGVGATPGITNMMVARAAQSLDQLESVEIAFAAYRALAPAPGLLTTTIWEFDPEADERAEVYFEDGEWHPAPPLSGEKRVRFHDLIGEQSVFLVPHDESYSMPQSYPSLRYAAVRGCFPPPVMEIMGALMRAGILTMQRLELDGNAYEPIELVRALLWNNPASRRNQIWAYGLVVEVTGTRNGNRELRRYRNQHPPQESWGGESAYYKNVGIPLSIGAQLLAAGQVESHGVLAPELALPVEPFFEALAQRGITVEESVERVE